MRKADLEPFGNIADDFLFWIKSYIAEKVLIQKVDSGYTDKKPKKNDESGLVYFDRELWHQKLINVQDIQTFKELTFEIRRKGLKKLATFSVPLIHLYEYLIAQKKLHSVREIDTNVIHTYIALKFTEYSEHTQKNYYVHIRGLFKFIDGYSLSDDNFQFKIGTTVVGKRAKTPVKTAPIRSDKYLEPNDFAKLIKSFKTHKVKHPNPFQPIFLMKVFCFTGMRSNELRNLKREDVNFRKIDGKKYIQFYVHGKNDQDRFVYVNYDLIKKEYEGSEAERGEGKTPCEYLFYTRDNKQYAENTIYDLVKRFYAHSDVDTSNLDTHGLRRSWATYLYSKGVEFDTISKVLGHTEKESSEFYIFASKQSFKDIADLLEES